MCSKEELFPRIGEVAEKTEQLLESTDEGQPASGETNEEEKTVQEIESMCMNCGRNVCLIARMAT